MLEFLSKQEKAAFDFDYIMDKIKPITPYGIDYKKNMKPYPLGTEALLIDDLSLLEKFVTIMESDEECKKTLKQTLSPLKDIRYSLERAKEGNILSEVEVLLVKILVFGVKDVKNLLEGTGLLVEKKTDLTPMENLERLLNPEGENPSGFYLYDAYSEELKEQRQNRSAMENEARREMREVREKIKAESGLNLNAESTVIVSKQDQRGMDAAKESENLLFQSENFNSVTFVLKKSDEMLSRQEEIEYLKAREYEEEQNILSMLTEAIAKEYRALRGNIHSLGNIDLYYAKAMMALKYDCIRPEIWEEDRIEIEEGRYLKIEENLRREGLSFTPISLSIEKGVTCITGANMGGKTISLKIIGLLVAMAQYGLFVPAKAMHTRLSAFIRSSIGDYQSTTSGLSTFGGEIENLNYAIEHADKKGLILMDELARGTNPQEGFAISYAIVDTLKDKEAITVLTTHFDQIAELTQVKHLQVIGLANVDFSDEEFSVIDTALKRVNRYMDYRLREVDSNAEVPKDAIRIARLMGLPENILETAENILINGR